MISKSGERRFLRFRLRSSSGCPPQISFSHKAVNLKGAVIIFQSNLCVYQKVIDRSRARIAVALRLEFLLKPGIGLARYG